ncbi:MAG: hypothetical protein ABI234_02925 [Ktedonobacteraceae bacterium]
MSAIFCDACRLSLLERSVEEQQEQLAEGRSGEGMIDLVSLPQMKAAQSAPLRMTEGGRSLFWRGAGSHTVETLEEESEVKAAGVALVQSTNEFVVAAPPVRRRMPTRVRRALLVFCIVGVLALTVDGVLLALSIMRHNTVMQGVSSPTATTAANPFSGTPGASATAGTTSTTSTTSTSGHTQSPFALSSSRLLFTTAQGQADPQPQVVTLLSGEQQPFSWDLVPVFSVPTWLHLSAAQGNVTSGIGAQVIVSVLASQLAPGTYTTNLLIKAFDPQGKALPASPQTLTVLLIMQIPCSLSVTPGKISFTAVLLSPPTPQTLTITENGDCTRPVSWLASASETWLTFSRSSGFDNSTITIQASSSGKLIGAYTAHITLVATDAHGIPLMAAPVTITATLTVFA